MKYNLTCCLQLLLEPKLQIQDRCTCSEINVESITLFETFHQCSVYMRGPTVSYSVAILLAW